MMLKHYKKEVLTRIDTETNNPQNWRIKNWVNDERINVKRLLKDMQREKLISIHFEEDRGKVKRILTKINDITT